MRSSSYTDTGKLKSSRSINTAHSAKPNELGEWEPRGAKERQLIQTLIHKKSSTVYKKEYLSEPETENEQNIPKMTTIKPKQYEGIGPTTREGVPLTLRSVIKWFIIFFSVTVSSN